MCLGLLDEIPELGVFWNNQLNFCNLAAKLRVLSQYFLVKDETDRLQDVISFHPQSDATARIHPD